MISKTYFNTEIGVIEITGTENGILSVEYVKGAISELQAYSQKNLILTECVMQLDEYFNGVRKEFSLKIDFVGSDFQIRVWTELMKIPYGDTSSYMEIADLVGNKKAVRAVGNANRLNKIAIIVPCHRVIGANGDLKGYAGELWRKKWLLEHEKRYS